MPLIDVTRWFKDPAVDWTLRGRAFRAQFDRSVDVERGLYVYLDTNASELPIYNRNKGGKRLVFGASAGEAATAIKYGKFVGGLAPRMLQNHDHMHRRWPDGREAEAGIFAEVASLLHVLDLSNRCREDIRALETEWNRGIRAALQERALVHVDHIGKFETVNLARGISCKELLEIVSPVAARIAPAAA